MRTVLKRLMFGCIALVFAVSVSADTEYKSVDAEGNVTYSDQIPEDAVRAKAIAVDAEPNAEDISKTKDRVQAAKQEVETAEDGRATSATASTVTSPTQMDRDPDAVWVDGSRRRLDPRGPHDPRDIGEHREVADAEERKEVADAEPRKEVADAEPRKEVADAEPRKEVADAEPRKEVADAEPRKVVADAAERKEVP